MWLRQPDNWSCWLEYSAEELHNPHNANKNCLLSKGALSLFNTCNKPENCAGSINSENNFFWHHSDPQNWIGLGSMVWFSADKCEH